MSVELAWIGVPLWLATAIRVGLGVLHAEPWGQELTLAWVVLALVPMLFVKAFAARHDTEN